MNNFNLWFLLRLGYDNLKMNVIPITFESNGENSSVMWQCVKYRFQVRVCGASCFFSKACINLYKLPYTILKF